jgi:iron complex outermembrane recepter protein
MLIFSNTILMNAQSNCSQVFKGLVLETQSGLPIEKVAIYIEGSKIGSYTNINGEFELKDVCEGTFILVSKHLNHEINRTSITVAKNNSIKTIYLNCHTDTLHQVNVKGARIHWENVSVSNKVQGEDLKLNMGQSLGKSLEKINGVYNLSTGNNINKPVVRGLHSNRVVIMNNEIRQEGQQWGNEHAPEIDPSMAREIEVVKGAQSIRYGSDIIGGIILVNPASLKDIKNVQAEINIAGFTNGRGVSFSSMVEGRNKKVNGLTWRIQSSFKRSGNNKTPSYFLKNTGMSEINYSVALGYQKKNWNLEFYQSYFNTKIGIFAGSHIGNLTDLYTAFESKKPIDSAQFSYAIGFPYQHVVHYLAKLKFNYIIKNKGIFSLLYGFQKNNRKEFDKTLQTKNADGTYKPALNFDLFSNSLDVNFEHKTLNRFSGNFGLATAYQKNNYYGNYFIPNYDKINTGLYWVEKWHKNRFSIESGIRYDVNYFSVVKWNQNTLNNYTHFYKGWASTIATRYQFPFFTLHANIGTAWRSPFVNELYSNGVHHSAASFEIGDENLVPERNYNTSFTIDFNYKNKIDMELTFYNNFINNYINLQPKLPATLTIRGAFPTFAYSQVDANFKGIEYTATLMMFKKMQHHFKANLTLAKDVTHNQYLVGIPPARIEHSLDWILITKKTFSLKWSFNNSYTFQQIRVEPNTDYVNPPKAYYLANTDIIIHYKNMFLNIGIHNLLNQSYRDYMNRNRYFANEIGRNIITRISIPIQPKHQPKQKK